MGLFGYQLLKQLSPEEQQARREALDLNATIAQASIGVVLAVIQLYFLISWLSSAAGKKETKWEPSSPYVKHELQRGKKSFGGAVKRFGRRVKWYMDEPVVEGWGSTGAWFAGSIWMAWLLALCVRDTGDDYMHVAKRFGLVGASQLPLHYLLAIKSPWSPIALLTRRSQEQLNVYHQILGRIIQTLFSLHAIFYLNFFWQFGWLAKRVKDNDVILGLSGITIIAVIGTTALGPLRRLSYRVFYFVHIIGATILLPVLYYHVRHLRMYILESAAVYVLHILLRWISSKTYPGTLSIVPGTNLVRASIPSPKKKWKAGQHVYLTTAIPITGGTVGTLKNPFTIASIPRADGNLTLIARTLKGPTKTLASKARASALAGTNTKLQIEGPYGIRLPSFAQFDRILLVAGGVGATFIIPIYRSIITSRLNAPNNTSLSDIRLIWSVRKISETSWALPIPETSGKGGNGREMGAEQDLYITGTGSEDAGAGYKEVDQGESIEMMGERGGLVGDGDEGVSLEEQGMQIKYRRPDLRDLVDETFGQGQTGKVAVLVCGPPGMGAQVRREVGRWVKKGKNVYFHSEEFGL
ncbi:hypothetical protein E2P81_ATG02700 [Venturia nashicola]|uniref:ferric-chelate reductase (NADPH) n=1 Tax=Venturia nashicola TaxID=86259 RepID=A0A4Z1P633_9PEZI|nr:hypothetical protein E6O75_ATG02762 [Venturia nashicola]TLD36918.1 hypothetical protein E2P81_ATG02700 [Venturia nashicola]